MPYARELTYCGEDWNTQPCRPHSINGSKISKTRNKYPEAISDEDNWLHEFEDVCSKDQKLYVRPIIRECEVVQVCVFMWRKIPTNYEKIWFTNLNRKNSK